MQFGLNRTNLVIYLLLQFALQLQIVLLKLLIRFAVHTIHRFLDLHYTSNNTSDHVKTAQMNRNKFNNMNNNNNMQNTKPVKAI